MIPQPFIITAAHGSPWTTLLPRPGYGGCAAVQLEVQPLEQQRGAPDGAVQLRKFDFAKERRRKRGGTLQWVPWGAVGQGFNQQSSMVN